MEFGIECYLCQHPYHFMKRIFTTITAGRFWLNILLIAIFAFLLIKVTMYVLGLYTQHGESTTVPDLTGYPLNQISTVLSNSDLQYEIADSIYSDEVGRGVVVSQNPDPNMNVKQGRTIFLTVNSILPEMVTIPELVGKSRRIALPLLEIAGLKLENLTYRPDDSCTDCVLGIEYEGKPIRPGEKIRKGQKITIILGRQSNVNTEVPDVVGKTYKEAVEIILSQSLNMGEILTCIGCQTALDTASSYVANQLPGRGSYITLGSYIDLYLTMDPDVSNSFSSEIDTTQYEME